MNFQLFYLLTLFIAGIDSLYSQSIQYKINLTKTSNGFISENSLSRKSKSAPDKNVSNFSASDQLKILIFDSSDKELYSIVKNDPRVIRSEQFSLISGKIEKAGKYYHKNSTVIFYLPINLDFDSLKIQSSNKPEIDLIIRYKDFKKNKPSVEKSSNLEFEKILDNGNSSEKIDMVLIGDGYSKDDLDKYKKDVNKIIRGYFEFDPYKARKNDFNVYRIDAISKESGVDHPEKNEYRDTILNSKYNCNGIQRLICSDTWKANSLVSSILNNKNQRDIIMVVVNDSEYGGSGGSISVISTNEQAVNLALHEIGHSFGKLGDEYDYSPPPCMSTEPREKNVTREKNRTKIKWRSFIEHTTDIPTKEGMQDNGTIGLFDGARYCKPGKGMYRPTEASMMRVLGKPFHAVNKKLLEDIIDGYLPN